MTLQMKESCLHGQDDFVDKFGSSTGSSKSFEEGTGIEKHGDCSNNCKPANTNESPQNKPTNINVIFASKITDDSKNTNPSNSDQSKCNIYSKMYKYISSKFAEYSSWLKLNKLIKCIEMAEIMVCFIGISIVFTIATFVTENYSCGLLSTFVTLYSIYCVLEPTLKSFIINTLLNIVFITIFSLSLVYKLEGWTKFKCDKESKMVAYNFLPIIAINTFVSFIMITSYYYENKKQQTNVPTDENYHRPNFTNINNKVEPDKTSLKSIKSP